MNDYFNSSTQVQNGFLRVPRIQTTYGTGDQGEYVYVDGFEYSGYVWSPKLDQPGLVSPQYNSPIDPVTGERTATPFVSKGKNNME